MDGREIVQRDRIVRRMIDYHDVVADVGHRGPDAFYALAQQVPVVLGRDDDGDVQAFAKGIANVEQVEARALVDGPFLSTSVQVALQHGFRGRHDFVPLAVAGRAAVYSPPVEDFLDM